MRIAVVGLGMAGSTLACLLADRGLDVTVIEQLVSSLVGDRTSPWGRWTLPELA